MKYIELWTKNLMLGRDVFRAPANEITREGDFYRVRTPEAHLEVPASSVAYALIVPPPVVPVEEDPIPDEPTPIPRKAVLKGKKR